jgi:hypothetical protein
MINIQSFCLLRRTNNYIKVLSSLIERELKGPKYSFFRFSIILCFSSTWILLNYSIIFWSVSVKLLKFCFNSRWILRLNVPSKLFRFRSFGWGMINELLGLVYCQISLLLRLKSVLKKSGAANYCNSKDGGYIIESGFS